MIELGKAIRKERNNKNLSLRLLANQVEISASFLSDIELERRYPSVMVLNKLEKFLDCSLSKYDKRKLCPSCKRKYIKGR